MGHDIVYILLVKDYPNDDFYAYGVYRTLEGAKKQRDQLITEYDYLKPCIEIDEESLED